MNRLSKVVWGLGCIIGSTAHAVNLPIISSNQAELTIQVTTNNELGCRSSLLACPGIMICSGCDDMSSDSATLTINNSSRFPAKNVNILINYSNFGTYVTQSGNCGVAPFNLAPNSSCNVIFSTTDIIPPYPGFNTTIAVAASNSPSVSTAFSYKVNG